MTSSIDILNRDCLLHIFSYLQEEDLGNTSLVCKSFFNASSDNYVWPKVGESDKRRMANITICQENCVFLKQFGISERFKTPMNVFTAERLIVEELKRKVASGELKLGTAIATELTKKGFTTDRIRLLIEIGAPFDGFILTTALRNNASLEIIRLLVEKGAKINAAALTTALSNKAPPETIEFLFKNGATIDSTVLLTALTHEASKDIIKFLLEHGAKDDKKIIVGRKIPEEILELLNQNGIQTDESDIEVDYTKPVFRSECSYVSIIPEMGGVFDTSFLTEAFDDDTLEEIKLDAEAIKTELGKGSTTERVRLWIEFGAPVDEETLYRALSNNASIETVQLLFENGCQIDESVIQFAKDQNVPPEILEFLLKNRIK